MATERIDITKLGPATRHRNAMVVEGLRRGLRMGARGGRAVLVRRTPKDRGQLKAGWRSKTFPEGKREVARVTNDAPYAGVVELGARPHQVSLEGRVAIAGWVRRHFPQLSDAEAWSFAHNIAAKLAAEGQAPTYFVRNSLPDLTGLRNMEINRALTDVAKKSTRGSR
jgi:hypothetical protein